MKESKGKKIKLRVDLTDCDFPQKDELKPDEVVTIVLENILFSYSGRGLIYADRENFYALTKALKKAREEKAEELFLSDNLFGFLKKAQRECKMVPSPILKKVEELIDDVKSR